MKFALVDKKKTEAIKGAQGNCPNCGEHKVNHWAHKNTQTCDSWWEPETDWHRSWKNKFPPEWQEISLQDERTKEKHIADIRTNHDLVIEFQHSSIKSEERIAREKFYQNMVWIVDETRLKRDYPRFIKAEKHDTGMPNILGVRVGDECFPSTWLGREVPVIFDFLGSYSISDNDDDRNFLYCLFPRQLGVVRIFSKISRKAFMKAVTNGKWTIHSRRLIAKIDHSDEELKKQAAEAKARLAEHLSEIAKKHSKRNRSSKRRNWRL